VAGLEITVAGFERVPPEDFYQLIFEFPKNRFLHTPSFVGMHYTDDLIILDLTLIEGRSKDTRLALLKDVNTRVSAAAGVSPDDLMITLYEAPGENFSFGRGEAQRANAVPARVIRRCSARSPNHTVHAHQAAPIRSDALLKARDLVMWAAPLVIIQVAPTHDRRIARFVPGRLTQSMLIKT
jgi:4-oxalocrotonate tautomerase